MRKLTCPPGTETLGQNLMAFTDNLQGSETSPVMEKYGLIDIDPHAWYPASNLLDGLNELAEKTNVSTNLTAIGMKIGEIVPMPPALPNPTLEEVLLIWDDIYQAIHRNGDVGYIRCEKVADKHLKTTHSDMYPDDLSYGVLYGYGRRFLPRGSKFTVFYDPDVKARDYGGDGDVTIIHIKWE